jgi:hypothetical protein
VEVKLNTFLILESVRGECRLTLRPFDAPEIVPIGQEVVWASEPVTTLWRREKSLASG